MEDFVVFVVVCVGLAVPLLWFILLAKLGGVAERIQDLSRRIDRFAPAVPKRARRRRREPAALEALEPRTELPRVDIDPALTWDLAPPAENGAGMAVEDPAEADGPAEVPDTSASPAAAPIDLAPPSAPDVSLPPVRAARAAAADVESAIGKKWLVRIGALVLVTGAAFFYAYAIDQGWVSKEQRAISGAVTGLAVVALGIRFNRRGFHPLAQGFVGCGCGILFLDAFASHRFYDLLSPIAALAAMTAVSVLLAVIALRWSAMPLVLLAQIGGYVSPLLLEDGMPDRTLVVFTYFLVISAGALFVGALKRWSAIDAVAFAAAVVAFALAPNWDPEPQPGLMTWWAGAFDVLFAAMAIMPAVLRRERMTKAWWVILPAMAVGTVLVASGGDSVSDKGPFAIVLLGLAAAYGLFAEIAARRSPSDQPGREVLRACAALMVLDGIRFPLGTPAMTVAFAVAGAGFALLGRVRSSVAFRGGAMVAFGIAIARVIRFHLHGADSAVAEAFWNQDFAVGMAIGAILLGASFIDRRTRWMGLSAAALLLVMVVTGEISVAITAGAADPAVGNALVNVAREVALVGVLVGFVNAARMNGNRILLGIGGLHGALALLIFDRLLFALQRPHQWLILNPVCLGSLFVPAGILAAAWLVRERRKWIPGMLTAIGAILPLLVLSIEAHRFATEEWGVVDAPVDAGSAAVSVTCALYAAGLLAIGISTRTRLVRLGALLLLSATLVKVVVSDLSDLDRLARIASFIVLGAVLMAGAWAYHRFSARIFGATSAAPTP